MLVSTTESATVGQYRLAAGLGRPGTRSRAHLVQGVEVEAEHRAALPRHAAWLAVLAPLCATLPACPRAQTAVKAEPRCKLSRASEGARHATGCAGQPGAGVLTLPDSPESIRAPRVQGCVCGLPDGLRGAPASAGWDPSRDCCSAGRSRQAPSGMSRVDCQLEELDQQACAGLKTGASVSARPRKDGSASICLSGGQQVGLLPAERAAQLPEGCTGSVRSVRKRQGQAVSVLVRFSSQAAAAEPGEPGGPGSERPRRQQALRPAPRRAGPVPQDTPEQGSARLGRKRLQQLGERACALLPPGCARATLTGLHALQPTALKCGLPCATPACRSSCRPSTARRTGPRCAWLWSWPGWCSPGPCLLSGLPCAGAAAGPAEAGVCGLLRPGRPRLRLRLCKAGMHLACTRRARSAPAAPLRLQCPDAPCWPQLSGSLPGCAWAGPGSRGERDVSAMFSGLISALQGPAEGAVDDSEAPVLGTSQSAPLPGAAGDSQPAAAAPQLGSPPEAAGREDSSQAEQAQHAEVDSATAQPAAAAGRDASPAARGARHGGSRPAAAVAGPAGPAGAAGQTFSLWGMASGLVDTVRKGTNELATRCVD